MAGPGNNPQDKSGLGFWMVREPIRTKLQVKTLTAGGFP